MANTVYEDIFKKFLQCIEGYKLMAVATDLREKIMSGYLETAAVKFSSSPNMKKIDETKKCFTVELSKLEIQILAELMVAEWFQPKLLSDDLLKSGLTTKEYSEYSPAKLIEQFRAIQDMNFKNSRRLITIYNHSIHKISNLNKK